MKKRMVSLLVVLCIVGLFAGGVSASAAEPQLPCVVDAAELLTDTQVQRLEQMSQAAVDQFGVGVYVVTVEDYREFDPTGVYEATYGIYREYTMGEGAQNEGIMLLLSMAERDYALFCCGEKTEYAFNDYGRGKLEGVFLEHFANNDWYGGFEDYIRECASYLAQAEAGKPVSQGPGKYILIFSGISILIAAGVCAVLIGQMKSVHKKTTANSYTVNGLALTEQYDRFTHRTETRRRIENNNSSSGGGNLGQSGGGGSGSSGKF